ncbi:MAG: hypothetical protein R3F29_15180 [Planctomycetota bacterium]
MMPSLVRAVRPSASDADARGDAVAQRPVADDAGELRRLAVERLAEQAGRRPDRLAKVEKISRSAAPDWPVRGDSVFCWGNGRRPDYRASHLRRRV